MSCIKFIFILEVTKYLMSSYLAEIKWKNLSSYYQSFILSDFVGRTGIYEVSAFIL